MSPPPTQSSQLMHAIQQICSNETARISQQVGAPFPDLTNTKVACSPEFRAATAGCEAATCSPADYQTTQLLAQQLCGYLYQSNATLSSSVASAIASATAAAKLATEGKDPTDLSVLPPCAVRLYILPPFSPLLHSKSPIYQTKLKLIHARRTTARMHPPTELLRLRQPQQPRMYLPRHPVQYCDRPLRDIDL